MHIYSYAKPPAQTPAITDSTQDPTIGPRRLCRGKRLGLAPPPPPFFFHLFSFFFSLPLFLKQPPFFFHNSSFPPKHIASKNQTTAPRTFWEGKVLGLPPPPPRYFINWFAVFMSSRSSLNNPLCLSQIHLSSTYTYTPTRLTLTLRASSVITCVSG